LKLKKTKIPWPAAPNRLDRWERSSEVVIM
jgi:hypothetical protein